MTRRNPGINHMRVFLTQYETNLGKAIAKPLSPCGDYPPRFQTGYSGRQLWKALT